MSAASYYNKLSTCPVKDPLNTEKTSYTHSTLLQNPLDPAAYAPVAATPGLGKMETDNSRIRRRRFEKWKRFLRALKSLSQAVSVLVNVLVFSIMLYVNIKYYSTKDLVKDERHAWPSHGTKVWPSIMLLVAGGFTLVISILILLQYCISKQRASESWKVTLAAYVVHIGAWFIVSTLYKYEKSLHGNNNDLWGWSCASKANAVQQAFQGTINFNVLCSTQVCLTCP